MMLKNRDCLPSHLALLCQKDDHLTPAGGIQMMRRKLCQWGSAMRRLWIVLGIVAASSFLVAGAVGQMTPSHSVVSGSAPVTPDPESSTAAASESSPYTPSIEIVRPAPASSEVVIGPASLRPDPPKLPAAKASLIGGTIGQLA